MTDVWPCGLDLPRMRALLDAGQDVNEKMKGGATALCKAAYKNRSDAVALLLEYEAAPNSQCTNGDTALHYAMTYGDFDGVVELMLRAGASPGIRSHAGPSASMSARLRLRLLFSARSYADGPAWLRIPGDAPARSISSTTPSKSPYVIA